MDASRYEKVRRACCLSADMLDLEENTRGKSDLLPSYTRS